MGCLIMLPIHTSKMGTKKFHGVYIPLTLKVWLLWLYTIANFLAAIFIIEKCLKYSIFFLSKEIMYINCTICIAWCCPIIYSFLHEERVASLIKTLRRPVKICVNLIFFQQFNVRTMLLISLTTINYFYSNLAP